MGRNQNARNMALGGIMAALAVVLMAMGTLIPLATYVCPVLCMLILRVVLGFCGKRTAWAWYGVVTILSLLLAPDKEAAAVFAFLGYYPIIRPIFDSLKWSILLKFVFFNLVILLMYWMLMNLFGMTELSAEYAQMGMIGTVVLLILGNMTFYLLDQLLNGGRWLKHG